MATFITFSLGLFTALGNIKAIAGYVELFAQGVMLWYVNRMDANQASALADAAAFGQRATTDELRYQAAAKWQSALSKPRVSA